MHTEVHHRLRRRRLDTTADTLLREARLRGFTAEPELKREEWQTVEVHWPANGEPQVKLNGRRVDSSLGLAWKDGGVVDEYRRSVETTDLQTNALTRATQAHAQREEYHVRGAWRAGYDYLHVFRSTATFTPGEFSMPSSEYRPSDTAEHDERAGGCLYAFTYALCETDDAEIRAAIRGSGER